MPTDGTCRSTWTSLADYSLHVLDLARADIQRHLANGRHAGGPVGVNLTSLSDEEADIVIGEVATCGFEVVLIDDRSPARPGTRRSEFSYTDQQRILLLAKMARLAQEALGTDRRPDLG